MDPKRLFEEALRLPMEARAALAGELLQSLEGPLDQDNEGVETAWADEIRRRIDEIESGTVETVPWTEARHRILMAASRGSHD